MRDGAINIIIGGEAGQGLVTLGNILTKVLVRAGYHVVVTQDYQSRIRGGHNTYAIRVSEKEILAPEESVDILVAFDKDTVKNLKNRLGPDGLIVVDSRVGCSETPCLNVPFRELAADKFANVVAIGVVGALLGIGEEPAAGTVFDWFGSHGTEHADENRNALRQGYAWSRTVHIQDLKLPAPALIGPRLTMNGNEAIALGALSAGVKFCSFYPMTPATSIMTGLAAFADRMGIIVEQAEDEIAAINMAIGASFAGAPSLVATSGGGFALMTEAVSLAAMTETPVVVVIAQRPGPSTGLPTRTEQGDLEFVLHSGHGEFPRAIFAPGTVEECFHLTREAFRTAEFSHGPVFILTDQFLADSYRSVAPFPLHELTAIDTCAVNLNPEGTYARYADSNTGVSPRLLPGFGAKCVAATSLEQLVVADSDEHTEDGHLTEDLRVRERMVEKRWRKLGVLQEHVIPPEFTGDGIPDLALVSWGSSKGAVCEAAQELRANHGNVCTLHFSQVWPMMPDHFLSMLQQSNQVACVESNLTGQLARLIRRETGFSSHRNVLRYDGLPLTPEYILRRLSG